MEITLTRQDCFRKLAANYYLAPTEMSIAEFMDHAAAAGASGVGLTISLLKGHSPEELTRLARERGLFIPTLNSAGYFLFRDLSERARQGELNVRLIDAASRMEAGRLVVIAGGIAESGLVLEDARLRVADAVAELDDRASAAGVRLALEPIHPADLTTKGCVNSIKQALDIIRPLRSTDLVIDTFHSAWDEDIWRLHELCLDKVGVVQVCNWYEPSPDQKPQRDLPSIGVMDLAGWLRVLISGGYRGPIEFELFNPQRRGRTVPDMLSTALRELREMMQEPC